MEYYILENINLDDKNLQIFDSSVNSIFYITKNI